MPLIGGLSIIVVLFCAKTVLFFLFSRSKLHTYDDVVDKVARQIGLEDPTKIRLTAHNCYSQQPKPQPIKYRGVEHLTDMLVHYNQVGGIALNSVFYLILTLINIMYCGC